MIRGQLLAGAQSYGHFVKFSDSPAVDASLLGLCIPYGVVAPDDPIMLRTVEQIELTILGEGGLHRYAEDSYYGGGEWILLTAWLGWYYIKLAVKRPDWKSSLSPKIHTCLEWVEAHAGNNQYLPEQVPENLNVPAYYSTWVDRWGEIASPLLWSHANYIILRLEKRSR
jgi:GH15 family glucan-1,4-alpha-glucosidase